ncbi:threonine aldolase family protein [Chiayiivirga flava]|uniref:Threonine aldolase n=1 Tax=Chiayiivirga flava TaxID=659595 RepID=A0A7W8G082_9GAMM|nr:beta-eliminating lyase-related protein [Chiayiivirga flava]MBB5206495.1 threonine aldolase [Chiayiivirga flava]
MKRRHFLAAGGAAAVAPALAAATVADASSGPWPGRVNFIHDGLNPSPDEYARTLATLAADPAFAPDGYSLGGSIAQLEQAFAERLGKQAAIFLPTGTLANHIAVRQLAGADRRVLVQAESHLYNDSGDGAATLSGLTLLPLGEGRATVTVEDAQQALERARSGRVRQGVGVLSIETPVRRRQHAMVDPAQLDRLCAWARGEGIRLHLDGARLFNLPQHSGRSVREYAAPFDTVFVSLWKHFNAASGAILAGDADFIDGLYHVRRMFGGSLPQAWPLVAPAMLHLPSYEQDYARAWQTADAVLARLNADGRFGVRRLDGGTSLFLLTVADVAPDAFVARAAERGIDIAPARPDSGEFAMQVNLSLLRRPAEEIARVLIEAAG